MTSYVIKDNLNPDDFDFGVKEVDKISIFQPPTWKAGYKNRISWTDSGGVFFLRAGGNPAVNPDSDDGTNWIAASLIGTSTNSAPAFTSSTLSNQAPSTSLGSVTATDADGDTVTYSITGGADQALFTINSTTGAVNFVNPSVAGNYIVEISANDGTDTTAQNFTVTVAAVANSAPVITSSATQSANLPSGAVYTITATDTDGDTLTYSITSQSTSGFFAVNSTSGVVTIVSPLSAVAGVYTADIQVSDGTVTTSQTVNVTVNSVPNTAPSFTTGSALSGTSGTALVDTLEASDAESSTLTFSITGGTDQGLFSLSNVTATTADLDISGAAAPGTYSVEVTVDDGAGLTTANTFTVTMAAAPSNYSQFGLPGSGVIRFGEVLNGFTTTTPTYISPIPNLTISGSTPPGVTMTTAPDPVTGGTKIIYDGQTPTSNSYVNPAPFPMTLTNSSGDSVVQEFHGDMYVVNFYAGGLDFGVLTITPVDPVVPLSLSSHGGSISTFVVDGQTAPVPEDSLQPPYMVVSDAGSYTPGYTVTATFDRPSMETTITISPAITAAGLINIWVEYDASVFIPQISKQMSLVVTP